MEASRNERGIQTERYRVTRDYCYMRIEILAESPAVVGVSVEHINEISTEFHAAQIRVLESMSKAERIAEFAHTISFEKKFRSLKSRVMQANKDESLLTSRKCTELFTMSFDGYHTQPKQVSSKSTSPLVVPPQSHCEFCPDDGHMGEACPTILKLSPTERFKNVKDKRLCILCLQPSHLVKRYTVKVLCSECNQRHHTLLHVKDPAPTQSSSQEPKAVKCELGPQAQDLSSNLLVEAAVLQTSCQDMATGHIDISSWEHLKGLKLAGPEFNTAEPVNDNMLVSVNALSSALKPGLVKGAPGQAIAIPTIFGWIVMGECTIDTDFSRLHNNPNFRRDSFLVSNLSLNNSVDIPVSVNDLSSALKPGLMKGAPGQAIAIPTIFGWIVMGECRIDTDFSRLRCNPNIRRDCFLVSNLSLSNPVKESLEPHNVELPKSTPSLSIPDPTVRSRYIEPLDTFTKQVPVGQPFLLIEIQDGIPSDSWHHVLADVGNSVDHDSRGSLPAVLTPCQSWWSGSRWMANPPKKWLQTSLTSEDEAELVEQKSLEGNMIFVDEIINRSSFSRIASDVKLSEGSTSGLSLIKVTEASHSLVEHVQDAPQKLHRLVDMNNGLLKGRLSGGELSYNRKQRLLLRDRRLAHLPLGEHRRRLHSGPQTLRILLVPDSWVLSAKRTIPSMVIFCATCFCVDPRLPATPLVANLPPSCRINQMKSVSLFYAYCAGSLDALGRSHVVMTYQECVGVFVCTAIKVVHLELASELTAEAYLSCLRWFIVRRGRRSRLVSDQGTNVVGSSNVLIDSMLQASQTKRVDFRFNPPGSLTFPGLVEGGFESVKIDRARVVMVGPRLIHGRFSALLIQSEILLYSRPLPPLSSDPYDPVLPDNFLTLEPRTLLPEAPILENHVNPYRRWRLIQKRHQNFGVRCHLEYKLILKHQSHRWVNARDNIVVETLVLPFNERCSPMKWKLGWITRLHSGTDNVYPEDSV